MDSLTQELQLLGTYGLRNKKELRRTNTELSRIRKQARQLLAASEEVRSLIGYSIHPPFMGYTDGVHPEKLLK